MKEDYKKEIKAYSDIYDDARIELGRIIESYINKKLDFLLAFKSLKLGINPNINKDSIDVFKEEFLQLRMRAALSALKKLEELNSLSINSSDKEKIKKNIYVMRHCLEQILYIISLYNK